MNLRSFFGLFSTVVLTTQLAHATLPKWSYDPGPDPRTRMGKELIDLTAAIPNMPEISMKVMGDQKFRPAFGPVNWRMLQGKNKVKILFIGQDATHIAEAAGRTATAGFGGRAQDLAAYFGVNEGAAFINTYSYTIRGQYGAYQTPYIYRKDGEDHLRFGNYVDNELWLMSQDLDSPMVKWRNNLIDWIIRNNKGSLKLIVTFGGAARDAIATYIESKGGKVGARHLKNFKNIQMPETDLVYAGGNNEFPIVVDENGKDLYSQVMGRRLDYTKAETQEAVKKDIQNNLVNYLSRMVFTKGGSERNGLLHPAQIDGFDLNQIVIAGKKTRSLRNLKLRDGSTISQDLLVVELPHPTFLSNLGSAEASKAVAEDLSVLDPYVKKGWRIMADPDQTNRFAMREPYRYSRADIGPEYYDFGTPGTRMVPVSTASRMSGNSHVIVFGTRERVKFDMRMIDQMTKAMPAESFSNDELFIARPRSPKLRYIFDPGPGEDYARLMKENLDFKTIYKTKPGKTFKTHGIDAYAVKTHPDIGDFGHYRGTFKNPQVIIVADPEGYDDLITARALTGTRGQYLHGLMKDIGVNDQYLVIKTLPFGMDGASAEDWNLALRATDHYRSTLLEKLMKETKPTLIIADGAFAQREVARILKGNKTPIIKLNRSSSPSADIKSMTSEMKKFTNARISGLMANIPRSHLSFYARTWEGTSGDRVLASMDKFRGIAFAEVAPAWAWEQKSSLKFNDDENVLPLIDKLEKNNLPLPGEKIPQFLRRVDVDPTLTLILELLKTFEVA